MYKRQPQMGNVRKLFIREHYIIREIRENFQVKGIYNIYAHEHEAVQMCISENNIGAPLVPQKWRGGSGLVYETTRRLLLQLLASVLSSHVRFQILDSSYQFNLCRWYY